MITKEKILQYQAELVEETKAIEEQIAKLTKDLESKQAEAKAIDRILNRLEAEEERKEEEL